MRKVNQLLYTREDNRGKLIELFKGRFAQCNLLLMKKGTVWGKHYHKKTTEYFYILQGKLSVSLLFLKDKKQSKEILKAGDSFIIKPYTLHTLSILKPSQCLVLYTQKFSPKKPDLYYLPTARQDV